MHLELSLSSTPRGLPARGPRRVALMPSVQEYLTLNGGANSLWVREHEYPLHQLSLLLPPALYRGDGQAMGCRELTT